MTEIEKMNLQSEDLVKDRIEKLKELFPEIITETENTERERTHSIDFEKLRLLLGDEVDEGQERYAFTWPGKADAIRQSQTVSTATLRPCVEKSRGRDGEDGSFDSDNLYIEGDNLEVLKLLQRGYHGKVKMIYIDPPYNTGHDFVYKDSFGDTIANYKEQAGLTGQSNADTSGRYHSDWLSMMYPRLHLARELLTDDGVIFISIDDNEVDNLKKIADEVFGEANFAARFMWTKTMTPPALAYKCRKTVEYVLCYERKANESKFFGAWLDNGDAPLLNTGNPIKTLEFPAGSIRFNFINRGVLPAGGYEGVSILENIKIENGVNANKAVLKGQFKWQQSTLDDEIAAGTYFLAKTKKMSLRFQRIANDDKYKTPTNYMPIKLDSSVDVGTNESASTDMDDLGMGGLFDFTKPKSLVIALIKMRCFLDKNDIICDFFSGSSTTAASVLQLNAEDGGHRKCISVQLPEIIEVSNSDDSKKKAMTAKRIAFLDGLHLNHDLAQIGEERIRRAGNKIKTEIEKENAQPKLGEEPKRMPDIGFRVFELDSSGIERPEPGTLMRDVVKPDRSELDIVFEMMLKWGLELTLPVERVEVVGYPVWSVAADELICCMDPGLTTDALQAVADLEPRRVLILDSILDDSLKLNAVQIFKNAAERTGSEIELRTV